MENVPFKEKHQVMNPAGFCNTEHYEMSTDDGSKKDIKNVLQG